MTQRLNTDPVHRVLPAPSASGISFRPADLPQSSYAKLREICQFYETKAGGSYRPEGRASRYLFNLSREIQEQVASLEELDGRKSRRIAHLERVVDEWTSVFDSGRTAQELGLPVGSSLTPRGVYDALHAAYGRMREIERALRLTEQRRQEEVSHLEKSLNDLNHAARVQHDTDVQQVKDSGARAVVGMQNDLKNEVERLEKQYTQICRDVFTHKESEIRALRTEYDDRLAAAGAGRLAAEAEGEALVERTKERLTLQFELRELELRKRMELMENAHQREMKVMQEQHRRELSDASRQANERVPVETKLSDLLHLLSQEYTS